MKRRQVLFSAATALSLGFSDRLSERRDRCLSIRIWSTEGAASYPGCRRIAETYLRSALGPVGHELEITFGEHPLQFSEADREVERVAWPARVMAGHAGLAAVDPVRDVNLLLTDGQVAGDTAGYAYDHIATVPGARYLAEMQAPESAAPVADYTAPAAVTQLLLHEVGHALGLDHRHGSVNSDESAVTVSPMISGYAWSSERIRRHQVDGRSCGADGLPTGTNKRRLSMRYSRCAEARLRSYRGGLPV